jgi:HAD superfamily hydrolase (TIGR01509 family)
MQALLFDCDGVLVDTEKDGHRVSFNRVFSAKGLDTEWSVELYAELLKIAGGKERMRHFFDTHGWPEGIADRDAFVKELHLLKTDAFMSIIEEGALPLRPGVARLVDEALAHGVKLAICSTSNEKAVTMVARKMLGEERTARFSAILAGDVVKRKKPDPEIYLLAAQRLGVAPSDCVVVEDSRNGLLAATGAGMRCVVTTSVYTEEEEFTEASLVVPYLGDAPDIRVTIDTLFNLTNAK